MQAAWDQWHFDVVKRQLRAQGLSSEVSSLYRWLFKSHRQIIGDPFAGGMLQDQPWSVQISSLMRAAKLEDSLLYTVIPQEVSSSGGNPVGHMFLIAPLLHSQQAPLWLVVEHALIPPLIRQALGCDEPCYVRKLFDLAGLGAWCNRRHICGVTFIHGLCRRDFKNDEIVEVPTASKVSLFVQLIQPTVCQEIRPLVGPRPMIQARRVASMLFPEGSSGYTRIVRQAHQVLTHRGQSPEQESEEVDDSILMQSGYARLVGQYQSE